MRFSGLLSFLVTGKPFSDRELEEVRGEVSFSEAINAHLAWKQRLIDSLSQTARTPPPEDIGQDTQCPLGKWIHGVGRERYGDLPSFEELHRRHADFHRLARQVVELSRARKIAEAQHLLSGEFQQASLDVMARIRHLAGLFGS